MKRIVILIAMLMLISVNAYAVQKLINITEDTIPEDSYRPVAGKEFLVAVKLVDVDVELNTEQPISNETIIFQTSMGTLSETEVTTNIYGEAITWLTTDTTPDTSHSITASVKDKSEITPIAIEVKNIALPQDAPTAEELIQKVEENNAKIQDFTADIQMTSNASWTTPQKQLKIWRKGNKYKVQEISPNPETVIRPELSPEPPPSLTRDVVGYNSIAGVYKIQTKETAQENRYPLYYDYVDKAKGSIIRKENFLKNEGELHTFITEDSNFLDYSGIWLFQKQIQTMYRSLSQVSYTTTYQYSNIAINTGIPDSEFNQ